MNIKLIIKQFLLLIENSLQGVNSRRKKGLLWTASWLETPGGQESDPSSLRSAGLSVQAAGAASPGELCVCNADNNTHQPFPCQRNVRGSLTGCSFCTVRVKWLRSSRLHPWTDLVFLTLLIPFRRGKPPPQHLPTHLPWAASTASLPTPPRPSPVGSSTPKQIFLSLCSKPTCASSQSCSGGTNPPSTDYETRSGAPTWLLNINNPPNHSATRSKDWMQWFCRCHWTTCDCQINAYKKKSWGS